MYNKLKMDISAKTINNYLNYKTLSRKFYSLVFNYVVMNKNGVLTKYLDTLLNKCTDYNISAEIYMKLALQRIQFKKIYEIGAKYRMPKSISNVFNAKDISRLDSHDIKVMVACILLRNKIDEISQMFKKFESRFTPEIYSVLITYWINTSAKTAAPFLFYNVSDYLTRNFIDNVVDIPKDAIKVIFVAINRKKFDNTALVNYFVDKYIHLDFINPSLMQWIRFV